MAYLSHRATVSLLWLLVVTDAALAAYFLATPQSTIQRIAIISFLCVFIVGLIAYRRGQQWPRYLIVVGVSLAAGLTNSEPYVSQQFTPSVLVAAMIALVLASAPWVAIVGATSYLLLLGRAGWSGVYAAPINIGLFIVLVSGMALARHLTDTALARAEEQARIIEQERASLAMRVEERTHELSEANARLRQASRLKDAFMASISHELRTPLNVILGNAELLQEGLYGAVDVTQRQALGHIEQSGRELLGLINNILDLAKMEAGKFDYNIELIAVGDICAQCVRIMQVEVEMKDLILDLDIDPEVGAIYNDARHLRQILLNLLSNAVKFTPEGGSIGLRAHRGGDVVDLTVWDTGIGISAADQELLFKPFTQLDTRLARRYGGTGLGLAMVAQLVAIHRGSISVESSPGQGSRFIVRLPVYRPPGVISGAA